MFFHLQPNLLTRRSMNQNILSCMSNSCVPPVVGQVAKQSFSKTPPHPKLQSISPVILKSLKGPRLGCQTWQQLLGSHFKDLILCVLLSDLLQMEINNCAKVCFPIVCIPLPHFISDSVDRTRSMHVHVRLSKQHMLLKESSVGFFSL